MEITPAKRRLIDLVEHAAYGKVCLPNFQRDFVWSRDEVADLLRSMFRGYFVGSLLMLRCDPDSPPFAPTALRGATPETNSLKPEWLVLDGQQRLTSLLYALSAPELGLKNSKQPRRYYLDLDRLMADPDDDDIVVSRTRREATRDGVDKPEGQWRQHLLPLTELLSEDLFLRWRDGIDDWLHETDAETHATFRAEWRDPWTRAVRTFQLFEAPVVELPQVKDYDVDAIGRVCAIFEKLNSTGVALSVYDLLTARLFRSQIDLHQLWDQAVDAHPLLADWSEGKADTNNFGVLVLRTVALLRDIDPKPKLLINLEPKDFEDDWRRAAAAMERALELATHVGADGFGVFNRKWLPGYGLLPVLAALRLHIEDKKYGDVPRAELRRWYWSSVFLERYSSAVETKSRRDFVEFSRRWAGEDVTPAVFVDAAARIGSSGYSVRDSASYASSVYSGIFCLLAVGGARDWALAETIELQKLEDHHIFPRGYLTTHGFDGQRDKTSINSVVNRTLISDDTNRRIRDRAPADYIADEKIFARTPVELLSPHFASGEALDALVQATNALSPAAAREAFERFSLARSGLIIAEVRRACGLPPAGASNPPEPIDEE